ncbi:hypothetical protein ACFLRF_00730 [Candidatus Altiarchaeota archaeon]
MNTKKWIHALIVFSMIMATVSASCDDTGDGGQITTVKGLTLGTTGIGLNDFESIWDSCEDADTVLEGWCDGKYRAHTAIDCESGYVCSDGACVVDGGGSTTTSSTVTSSTVTTTSTTVTTSSTTQTSTSSTVTSSTLPDTTTTTLQETTTTTDTTTSSTVTSSTVTSTTRTTVTTSTTLQATTTTLPPTPAPEFSSLAIAGLLTLLAPTVAYAAVKTRK